MGPSTIDFLLPRSIFLVSIGTNDLADYVLSNSTVPREQFITSIMATYKSHIKALYDLGARRFGIISVLPLGCNPTNRVFNATGGCVDALNELSLNFYLALDTLLKEISLELQDFKYSLGNTYRMIMNVIENPARYNFAVVDTACCGSGRFNAEGFCIPTANLCTNRSEYAFFDGNHPTDVAAELFARALVSGEAPLVSPINFGDLVA
jgi:phospholipase/lecithinase/hemolysin